MQIVGFFLIPMCLFLYFPVFAQNKQVGRYQCYSTQRSIKVYDKPDEKSAVLSTYEFRVLFDVLKENHQSYFKVYLPDSQKNSDQVGFVKKKDVILMLAYQVDDFDSSAPSKENTNSKPTLGEKPKVNCTLCPTNSSKSN